jgi:hypothetical protein
LRLAVWLGRRCICDDERIKVIDVGLELLAVGVIAGDDPGFSGVQVDRHCDIDLEAVLLVGVAPSHDDLGFPLDEEDVDVLERAAEDLFSLWRRTRVITVVAEARAGDGERLASTDFAGRITDLRPDAVSFCYRR